MQKPFPTFARRHVARFALALLFAGTASVHAISFNIGGITVDLPGYTTRKDPTDNQIAQHRAISADGKSTFAGGKFRHPKATLVHHVALLLALGCSDLAEFEKNAKVLGIPAAEIPLLFQKARETREPEPGVKMTLFRKVKIGAREGFQLNTHNTRLGIRIHTFLLPGRSRGKSCSLPLVARRKASRTRMPCCRG